MRLPPSFYLMWLVLQARFPNLRPAQHIGLTLWVYGTVLAGSACQNAVLTALEDVDTFDNLRQRLREWLYDGEDKAASCHTQVCVPSCCDALLISNPARYLYYFQPQERPDTTTLRVDLI